MYKKETNGQFSFAGGYSITDAPTGLRFDPCIKIRTVGNETVAYIGAEGDNTTNLPGKIYSIENSATKNWWLGIDPNTEAYLKIQWHTKQMNWLFITVNYIKQQQI